VITVGKYGMGCRARLSRLMMEWMDLRALFRQCGGCDVVVVALIVASRTILQPVPTPPRAFEIDPPGRRKERRTWVGGWVEAERECHTVMGQCVKHLTFTVV